MSEYPLSLPLSRHAGKRVRQRGIPDRVLMLIWRYADWSVDVGAGCRTLRITDKALAEMRENNEPHQLIDRAQRLIMVLAPGERIATVMHDRGHRGRRYRRQEAKYRSRRQRHNLHGRRKMS